MKFSTTLAVCFNGPVEDFYLFIYLSACLSVFLSVCLSLYLSVVSLSALQLQQREEESLSNEITGVGLVSGAVVPGCLSNYLNEGGKFDYKSAVRNK